MPKDVITNLSARGRVRASRVEPGKLWVPTTQWQHNLVVYEWGAIVSRLLALGEARYRIAGMYLEFENVPSPGDTVSAPNLDRTRDVEYYNNLVGSGDRDYLRVSMTSNVVGSSDDQLYPKGNMVTFSARSSGLQGVHGKTFSDTVNSVIFGGSLIAVVDNTDATQDLILSSFYFDTDDQQPKLSTSQVGIDWELVLQ